MYRLADAIPVKRSGGIVWTLTFAPVLPHSDLSLDARHIVVTVSDSRYKALREHGPNFTRDEIATMEPARTIRERKT